MTNHLREWALWAIRQGWYVAPIVNIEQRDNNKTAHGWNRIQSCDEAQVRTWFSDERMDAGTTTGYAVCLRNSKLLVTDVDCPENLTETFPDTFSVRTGRATGQGTHYYFTDHAGVSIHLPVKQLWGEFKGAHGAYGDYVVGPGSMHASGRTYEPLNQLPVADGWPAWVLKIALNSPAPNVTKTPNPKGWDEKKPVVGLEHFYNNREAEREIGQALKQLLALKLGERNPRSIPILGGLVRLGVTYGHDYSLDDIWKLLWAKIPHGPVAGDKELWDEAALEARWQYVQDTYESYRRKDFKHD